MRIKATAILWGRVENKNFKRLNPQNESEPKSNVTLSSGTVFFRFKVVLPSKSSIYETLVCDHSNEVFCGTVFLLFGLVSPHQHELLRYSVHC